MGGDRPAQTRHKEDIQKTMAKDCHGKRNFNNDVNP
jgi:hypothetical protein